MDKAGVEKLLKRSLGKRVMSFVRRHVDNKNINGHNVLMISDANALAGIANEGAFDYIISSAPLNDYVRVNESLSKIRRLLSARGIFIGNVETNVQRNRRIKRKYNIVIANMIGAVALMVIDVLTLPRGIPWKRVSISSRLDIGTPTLPTSPRALSLSES